MVNSRRSVRIAHRKPMPAKSEKRAIAACFDAYFDTSAAPHNPAFSGDPMDDHFWPSLYPGIILAVIIGFAAGGIIAIAAAVIGGLIGSVAAYFLNQWLGLQDSPISLAILLVGAAAGGYLGARVGHRLSHAK